MSSFRSSFFAVVGICALTRAAEASTGPIVKLDFDYEYVSPVTGCCGGYYDDLDHTILNDGDKGKTISKTNSIQWKGSNKNVVTFDFGEYVHIDRIEVSTLQQPGWGKYFFKALNFTGAGQADVFDVRQEFDVSGANGLRTITVAPGDTWEPVKSVTLAKGIPAKGNGIITEVQVYGRKECDTPGTVKVSVGKDDSRCFLPEEVIAMLDDGVIYHRNAKSAIQSKTIAKSRAESWAQIAAKYEENGQTELFEEARKNQLELEAEVAHWEDVHRVNTLAKAAYKSANERRHELNDQHLELLQNQIAQKVTEHQSTQQSLSDLLDQENEAYTNDKKSLVGQINVAKLEKEAVEKKISDLKKEIASSESQKVTINENIDTFSEKLSNRNAEFTKISEELDQQKQAEVVKFAKWMESHADAQADAMTNPVTIFARLTKDSDFLQSLEDYLEAKHVADVKNSKLD